MADPNLLAILDRMQQNHTETMQLLTTLVERLAPTNNQNNYQNPRNDNRNHYQNDNRDTPPRYEPPQNREQRWDGGLRVEIPDYLGSLNPEEYLDWTSKVEEVFELKEVPLDKQVPLVTIRLRDRAAAWWQSFKYRRYLDGLPPFNNWLDLKRKMNREFLPLNYRQSLFQQLQSLTQGSKSVEEYTLEFYRLKAHNQLNETEDMRVARYLHGLRLNIQDALVVHTFTNVAEAQAKAKAVEKQFARNRNFNSRGNSSSNSNTTQTLSRSTTNAFPNTTRSAPPLPPKPHK